ncbi:MAG: porin [Desulfobacterales bacterium]|nr:porin [Desulfobacterales bacterium]
MKKLIVILAAIAMVGSFTATAMADVDLYGSARFRTYYADVDDGDGPLVDSDSDLEWRMGHLTRFGANFKSDKITGKFEMDARAGGAGSTALTESSGGASGLGNMRLRHLWGQYDFGAGKLMIGQNYPLFDAPVSGINYYSGGFQPLGGIGITDARTSQIRLTFGDFRLAFLQADTTNGGLATMTEVNTMFPKIEVRYDMKLDAFALNFIGGYQSYEIEDYNYATGAGTRQSEDITSWVLGARGKANFGPVYVGLSLNYRQNGDNYGAWTASTKELAVLEGTSIKDATGFGYVAAVGYKVNDMFTLEASYGSLTTEQDTALNNEDDGNVWGLMAKITLAPGVYIIPEFIMQDNKDVVNDGVSTEQGDATIFGVFWMINFK